MDKSNNLTPIQYYFEISPRTMRRLMLATSKLSTITNSEKIDDNEKKLKLLEMFKNKNQQQQLSLEEKTNSNPQNLKLCKTLYNKKKIYIYQLKTK
jgi:hypothetical protein